jgi:hypothetical protein
MAQNLQITLFVRRAFLKLFGLANISQNATQIF